MKIKSFSILFLALTLVVAFAASAMALGTKELDNEKLVIKFNKEVMTGGYKVVNTATLKKWIDAKKPMLIVDTMPYEASYKKQHVPQAKQFLFPIPDMNQWNPAETGGKSQADYEKLLGPDKNKTLVIYCGFVKCTRSHNGATWAVKLGYKHVYRFAGGIYAWIGAGYPVEKAE